MKNVYISLFLYIFISCSQNNDTKKNHDYNIKDDLIEFEDIYSNQQQSGNELGPWWIFYKIKIHNNTDSTISLYPKKDSVSTEGVDFVKRKKVLTRDELLKYIISTPGVGDSFLLFKNDTIPLYCKYRPIVLSQDSCNRYLLYTNSSEIKHLYDYYNQEYTEFQCFLSDIVKYSTFVMIFNKKDTCYFSPGVGLNFRGNPEEQVEWSFW